MSWGRVVVIIVALGVVVRPATADTHEETVAEVLSLGGTVAAYGLLAGAGYACRDDTCSRTSVRSWLVGVGAVGTLVAPAFGHWYEGHVITRGLVVRSAAIGVMLLGVYAVAQSIGEDGNTGAAVGSLLLLGGGGLYIYGTAADILSAGSHVRAQDRSAAVTVAPIGRGGLAVVGRF